MLVRLTLFITLAVFLTPMTAWANDELQDGTELRIERVNKHEITGKVNGKRVKIRLMGVDCHTKKSTKKIRKVAGKTVVLRSDKSFLPILKDNQDRYVAYVETKKGEDVGHALVKSGLCTGADWALSHPKKQLYASAN